MNDTDTTNGWVSHTNGRGTLDIIWTCAITISLCCWTSVYVNIPASKDTRWDRLRDKFYLFCLGMLGPEFLFMLALGQWESARRSVKKFHLAGYNDWTMTQAFFADMGGFALQTRDELLFPINAEQLFYLVSRSYLPGPNLETSEIEDKNKSDGLGRIITSGQVLVFGITCIARASQHLAITTLELTTIAFAFAMLGTSLCWRFKPQDIGRAVILRTDVSIVEILEKAGVAVNYPYECTPLDFINHPEWFSSIFWTYYTGLLKKFHIPLLTRRVKTRPVDRIRSDNFLVLSPIAEFSCGVFMMLYSLIFILAWNFEFPSKSEHILWLVSSLTILAYSSLGAIFFFYCDYTYCRNQAEKLKLSQVWARIVRQESHTSIEIAERAAIASRNTPRDTVRTANMPTPLFVFCTVINVVYCLARAYILIEDAIGLRSLPSSAFETVNWSQYMPHL